MIIKMYAEIKINLLGVDPHAKIRRLKAAIIKFINKLE